jgi:hypothetical protein
MPTQTNPCGDAGEVPDRVPAHLKKAMNDLLRHESTILNHLSSSPGATAKFLSDPATVLAELKIPVDSDLAASLRSFSPKQDPLAQRTFCLPDGTQLTPNIKVTFVAHSKQTTAAAEAKK